MPDDFALLGGIARISNLTWILADLVYALQVRRAIGVVVARFLVAGLVGVAGQSRRTLTGGAVVDALADGVAAAWQAVDAAYRCALSVPARVVLLAVSVVVASDGFAAGLGVFAVVSVQTGADGALVHDAALGVRAASTGVLKKC